MKISDVWTFLVGHSAFVQIYTDEGIVGLGEVTLDGRQLAAVKAVEHFTPVLLGLDPMNTEHIWQRLYRGSFWRGGPVLLTALSGIDLALWDIKGKALGTPVYNLLGGKAREKILVYRHIGGRTADELCAAALRMLGQGYRVLRICPLDLPDGPFEPGSVVRRSTAFFKQLRQTVGEDVEIVIDVHTRLSPPRAVELCNALAEYRPFFVEDPIRSESPEAFGLLRGQTRVPLATGEQLGAKWSFRALIENDWVDYIRADLCRSGGLTEVRKIAAMAETHCQEMALHNALSPVCAIASVHLSHALPNVLVLEFGDYGRYSRFLDFECEIKDGYVTIPPRPGLGIEMKEAGATDPFVMRELPHLRREDGAFQDW